MSYPGPDETSNNSSKDRKRVPGEWGQGVQGGAWLPGKFLRVDLEWPCVFPFLTWDLLRGTGSFGLRGAGLSKWRKNIRDPGGDQPMPSPSRFASSAQERPAGPGAVEVFRKV